MNFTPTRRAVVAGLAGSMVANPRVFAQTMPTSPVSLNIVDVAGNLALTQSAIETYRDKNPKLVSRITFSKAPAPELPGKIKAQQDANRVDIDGRLSASTGKNWIELCALDHLLGDGFGKRRQANYRIPDDFDVDPSETEYDNRPKHIVALCAGEELIVAGDHFLNDDALLSLDRKSLQLDIVSTQFVL